MKNKLTAFASFLSILFLSCGDGNSNKNNSTLSQQSDTSTKSNKSMQDEMPPTINQPRGEINDYASLPIDSMKIAYRDKVDTISGYKKGDTLLVEGDIMLNFPRKGTRGVATTLGLWPKKSDGSIVIRYAINPNYPFPDMVRSALNKWSTKTGIQFLEGRSGNLQGDFIEFVPSNNTQSYIGHIGGRQIIELADWAREGNIMHETGHSLGLYHEQSRADRDNFVQILCTGNVNYNHAFKEDPYARDIGPYNFYSIMHYPLVPGCLDMKPGVRERLRLPRNIPGQRDSLTVSDYTAIKTIYRLK